MSECKWISDHAIATKERGVPPLMPHAYQAFTAYTIQFGQGVTCASQGWKSWGHIFHFERLCAWSYTLPRTKILAMVRIQFIKLYNFIIHGFTETFCIMFQDGLTMEINMTFLSVQALILRQLVRVFNTPTSKDWLTLWGILPPYLCPKFWRNLALLHVQIWLIQIGKDSLLPECFHSFFEPSYTPPQWATFRWVTRIHIIVSIQSCYVAMRFPLWTDDDTATSTWLSTRNDTQGGHSSKYFTTPSFIVSQVEINKTCGSLSSKHGILDFHILKHLASS